MRHLITLALIVTLSIQNAISQNWLYTQQIAPITNAGMRGVTMDLDSNLYITAFHRSNSGVTNYTGPFGTKTYDIIGKSQDILLIKLDQLGDTIWTKAFGGTGSDYPRQVAIDNNNNPFIAGVFRSPSLTIQSSTLTNPTPSTYDIFLAKYTADGANGFARRVGFGPGDQEVSQIAIDDIGNIYMAGSYSDSIFFENDTLIAQTSSANLFLAKFKSDGHLRWAKNIVSSGGSSSTTNFVEISIPDNENIYLGGFFLGTLSIDGISITSQGTAEDMLILKVDSSGATQWMRMGGSNNLSDRCNGISTSASGDIYITGYFQGNATFDSTGRGLLNSSALNSAGGFDMFMAKYSPSGRLLWKRRNGNTGNDIAYGAKIRENILQFTGYFCGTLSFNNTTISSGSTTNEDAGYFVYDIDGNPITAKSVQGTLSDRCEYIEYGLKGNTYIGGYFKSPTLTIGTTTLTRRSSSGNSDAFVAKCHNIFSATFSNHSNIKCPGGNDGKLIVTSYFGNAPYIYDWSASTGSGIYNDSSATNLTAGFYQVSVTDSRDSVVVVNYTLTDPADFNIILDSTNLSCFQADDGTITTSATGGNGSLTYNWSGPGVSDPTSQNQSGLTVGLYKLTITDASGCNAFDSIEITQPAPIYFGTVAVLPEDPNGSYTGSIDLSVSGGTQPYTYSWDHESVPMAGRINDTLTNLSDGLYTAHINDNNSCLADTNIIVPGDSLRVSMGGTNISCNSANDGRAWADIVSGDKGFPFSYIFEDNDHNIITPVNDTLNSLQPGIYYVSVTEQGGENRTASSSIVISQPDSIDLTLSTNPLLCFGNSDGSIGLNIDGGTPAFTFNWSNGSSTQSITTLTAGWYIVTVTDAHSCFAIDSAEITQPDSLEIIITVEHAISCFNDKDGSLKASAYGGIDPKSYIWDDPGLQTEQIATNLGAGIYTVTATDQNGCTNTHSYNLTDPAILSLAETHIDASCSGENDGIINLIPTGGTPVFGVGYYYDWSNGQISQDISGLSPDIYSVTVTDANNCSNNLSVTIVREPPIIIQTIDITDASCYGFYDGAISITATGGSGVYQYSTDGGTNYITNSNITGIVADDYTVIVKDNTNCISSDSLITVAQPAEVILQNLSITAASCYGNSDGTIEITATGGAGTPFTYSINGGSSFSADSYFSGLTPDSYSVIARDVNNCPSSDSVVIVTSPSEVILQNIIISPTLCSGLNNGSIEITAAGGSGTPYTYSINGGISFSATSQFNGLSPDSYSVIARDANNCESSDSGVIVTSPSEVILQAIVITPTSCFGSNDGSIEITASGGSGNQYNYSINGGINYSSVSQFTGLTPDNYSVIARDGNNCESSDSGVIVKTPEKIIFQDIILTSPSCHDSSDAIIEITAGGGTSPYQYSIDGGSVYSVNNTFPDLIAQNYTLKILDAGNCESGDSVVIITDPVGVSITSETVTDILCNGYETGSINIVVDGTASDYEYSVDNGTSFSNNEGNFNNLPAGTYQVRIKDLNNCEYIGSILTVTEPDLFSVDTVSVTHALGEKSGSLEAIAEGGTSPYTYILDQTETDSISNTDGIFIDLLPGEYLLYATDINSCMSDSMSVTILQTSTDIKIFDAFSPNDDEHNNVWNILNIGLYPNCKVTIYNTWGSKVFSSDGYEEPWDGKFNDKHLPAGTYYYVIDLGDGSNKYSGAVSIVR
jgi:gliding motility-associated-like protein